MRKSLRAHFRRAVNLMRLAPICFSVLFFGLLLPAHAQDSPPCPAVGHRSAPSRRLPCLTEPEMAAHVAIRKPVAPPGLHEPSLNLRGTVEACLCFSPSGKVTTVQILSGPALLQQPVLESLKQWRFRPVLRARRRFGACGGLQIRVVVQNGAASSTLAWGKE